MIAMACKSCQSSELVSNWPISISSGAADASKASRRAARAFPTSSMNGCPCIFASVASMARASSYPSTPFATKGTSSSCMSPAASRHRRANSSLSIVFVLRVSRSNSTIAGRGRAYSPAPEGPVRNLRAPLSPFGRWQAGRNPRYADLPGRRARPPQSATLHRATHNAAGTAGRSRSMYDFANTPLGRRPDGERRRRVSPSTPAVSS